MLPFTVTSAPAPERFRCQGARIAAGFPDLTLVAQLAKLTAEEYAFFEQEEESAGSDWGPDLARMFGVSEDFLANGNVKGDRDALASSIAIDLSRCQLFGATGEKSPGAALQRTRVAAGHATPRDAAVAIGVNPLLYLAHEEGVRPLAADQLCFYVLALGRRPDQALAGAVPEALWSRDLERWWRAPQSSEFDAGVVSGPPAFNWLRTGNCAQSTLVLPVVEHVDGTWQVQRQPMRLPRSLLPATVGSAGDTLYAIIDRRPCSTEILIVDPTVVGRDSVLVTGGGLLSVGNGRQATKVVDPVHHRPRTRNSRFCVGSYVATAAAFG